MNAPDNLARCAPNVCIRCAAQPDRPPDMQVHAALARSSGSLSLASGLLAAIDWAAHLAVPPANAWSCCAWHCNRATACCITWAVPTPGFRPAGRGPRFAAPDWQRWPYNLWHQGFLLTEQWWNAATRDVWGVEKHHADLVNFAARQLLDMFLAGQLPLTNPEVLRVSAEQRGNNLLIGLQNCMNDMVICCWNSRPADRSFLPARMWRSRPARWSCAITSWN
jgi:polyhydroxyalkanoate synthase